MKSLIIMVFLGVVVSGPVYGASLHDIFSGIEDSLSEMWHADIFPDDTAHVGDQSIQDTSAAQTEAPFMFIIFGVFLVFSACFLLKRQWLRFVKIKNNVEDNRFTRGSKLTLNGSLSFILVGFLLLGGLLVFAGCAILLAY